MQISIIGTGYVGLTTSLLLSQLGHKVIGIDKDQDKLKLLNSGTSPIHEYGANELLAQLGDDIVFTDNLPGNVPNSDVLIIAVGTPPKASGEADVSAVEAVALEIADCLAQNRDYVIVVKSTVPIGTNKRVAYLVNKRLRERDIDTNVMYASNPEFLREGKALYDSFYPDRVLIGANEDLAQDILSRMYRPLIDQSFTPPSFLPREEHYSVPPVVITDPTSAELSKYACNAFLATKISFINEIAGLCDRVGADVTQVSRVMGLDHRICSPFLNAGLGWGGSCLPKDTSALQAVADEYDYELRMIEAAREVNERQLQVVIEKLQSELKVLRGQTIGVLGVAFKPDTDDVRDSASIALIRILLERGANIRIHDPIATQNAVALLGADNVEACDDAYIMAQGLDALLLATEWPEYAQLSLEKIASAMASPVLVDARNFLHPEDVAEAGMRYLGIGR